MVKARKKGREMKDWKQFILKKWMGRGWRVKMRKRQKQGFNGKGVFCFIFFFKDGRSWAYVDNEEPTERERGSLWINFRERIICNSVKFSTRGDFAPEKTSDNVWTHFWLSKLGSATDTQQGAAVDIAKHVRMPRTTPHN